MEITCDLAMDLVDIYTSGGASSDTKAAVDEHLKSCKSCRDFFDGYKKSLEKDTKRSPYLRIETLGADEAVMAANLNRLSKRLKTRQIISTICAVVTAVFGLAAVIHDILSDAKGKKR